MLYNLKIQKHFIMSIKNIIFLTIILFENFQCIQKVSLNLKTLIMLIKAKYLYLINKLVFIGYLSFNINVNICATKLFFQLDTF